MRQPFQRVAAGLLISLGFQPLAVALNSEEIVRSTLAVLAASIGLVLCVPITTAVAVLLVQQRARRTDTLSQ